MKERMRQTYSGRACGGVGDVAIVVANCLARTVPGEGDSATRERKGHAAVASDGR